MQRKVSSLDIFEMPSCNENKIIAFDVHYENLISFKR